MIPVPLSMRHRVIYYFLMVSLFLLTIVALTLYMNEYSVYLFLLTPAVLGFIATIVSGFLYGGHAENAAGAGMRDISWVLSLGSLSLLFIGLEGAICIVMALPFVLGLAWVGVLLGWTVLLVLPTRNGRSIALLLVCIIYLGAYPLKQAYANSSSPLIPVTTSVIVTAPPQVVWDHVVTFTEIPEPEEWIFRLGIAYPLRARIIGEGVGATRYCEFSTGPFVEPITVWDEPRHLAFNVAECPTPMKELSPWGAIHPPHLDDTMVSERGEFRLEELPDGSTRLIGTTWYRHGLGPNWYWQLWSDAIVHRIHERVLLHIKANAESARAVQ